MRILDKIKGVWPVKRKTHDAAIRSLKERHRQDIIAIEKEIQGEKKILERWIDHLSAITWNKDRDDGYRISFLFTPKILYGGFDQRELAILARHFGQRVEWDIQHMKFVERPRP